MRKGYETLSIQEQGTKDFADRYTKALAQSMQNTKEMVAKSIWEKGRQLAIYKIHMHAKKDWRVLRLVQGSLTKYETVSKHQSFKEAQAILKLMEG